jgi:hypothetical protein
MIAASARTDISPQKPATLGGYRDRYAPFEGITDPLEANMLWLQSEDRRLLIVTLDLLYPGRELRRRLLCSLGLRDEELFLAASHTHFAPMTTPGLPGLGEEDEGYIDMVARSVAAAACPLEGRAVPVRCIRRCGTADHAINRRLLRWRLSRSGLSHSCQMGPNPGGEKNEAIEALEFLDADDRPLALLWNYACHPTGFPDLLQVSAEFPGMVRARLRETAGPVPVLFLQGFSGDTRPPFYGIDLTSVGLARRLLLGPQFRDPSMAEWRTWAGSLAERVTTIFSSHGKPLPLALRTNERLIVPEAQLGEGGRGNKPLIWHHLDCDGFRIVGVNAEPVTAYGALVAAAFPDKPLLLAGCLDQTNGYLPTDAMLATRGYEVEGFRPLFNYETRFLPGLESAAMRPLFVRR